MVGMATRLPGEPVFYLVLNEQYATMIARDWKKQALRHRISDLHQRLPLAARRLTGSATRPSWSTGSSPEISTR
jgi:hypothetical protein